MTSMEECKNIASTLIKRCHDLLVSNDWKVERVTSEGDVISYLTLPEPVGKIFKITGIVDGKPKDLVYHLFDNIESSTSWNNHIDESKRIIDEDTDIIYQAAKSFGNGLIGARDFVVLRHRGHHGSYVISSNISVNREDVPKRKNFIRAENGVGCLATRSVPNGREDQCEFTWVLNAKMKGWIPQKMVELCTSVGLMNFMQSLRLHAAEINNSGMEEEHEKNMKNS